MAAVQILLPMAGDGTRFGAVGELRPKPLIHVAGRPMLCWALENLPDVTPLNPVQMIVRKDHIDQFPELTEVLSGCGIPHQLCLIEGPTPSPLHTIANAADLLLPGHPVMILNCDQFLADPIHSEVAQFLNSSAAAAAFTLDSAAPDYIHMEVNRAGDVLKVMGRGSVAAAAAAGIYLFRSAQLLFSAIQALLAAPARREHCVTDVLTQLLHTGQPVMALPLGKPGQRFHSLGTPALVDQFAAQSLYS